MNHALLHLLFGVMWACLQSSCMNAGGLRHQLCDSERCPVLQQCSCDRPPLAQTRERMYLCKCRYPRMEWIASSLTGGNSDYRDCFRRLTEKCFVVWRRTSACSESVFCFHVICSIHKAKVLRTNHLFNVSSSCKTTDPVGTSAVGMLKVQTALPMVPSSWTGSSSSWTRTNGSHHLHGGACRDLWLRAWCLL